MNMANKRLGIVFAVLFLITGNVCLASSTDTPPANAEIFQKLFDSAAAIVNSSLADKENMGLHFADENPCSRGLLRSLWKISPSAQELPTAPLSVADVECSLRYRLADEDDPDLIERHFALAFTLIQRHAQAQKGQPHDLHHKDTILRSHIPIAEEFAPPFARAGVPPVPTTFWDDIAAPLLVIVSSAITIFLLFSSRTQ